MLLVHHKSSSLTVKFGATIQFISTITRGAASVATSTWNTSGLGSIPSYSRHGLFGVKTWARILEENYITCKNFHKYGGFLLSCENS